MKEHITLTELQLIIKDSLYMSLPDMYWVVAEISEIKENYAGHCYLELIEKNADEKNVRSRIKAIIWSNRCSFLKSFFENITGESFREGLKILIKVKIEYHELYGLSLIISDIDPAFTVGEMAIKRQLVIKRLEEEGVFSMNQELEIPLVPQRIAVISSKKAAGYSDFINQLSGNSYRYVFHTFLIEAVMQGTDTEDSIIAALDKVAANDHLFDLVVIIRGGGSQSDLSWFDSYNIAYHITQFPLPVITGIGHEKDMSVSDMVACKSLKTPTAVADFLIEITAESENHLIETITNIKELSRNIIEKNKSRVETARIRIMPLIRLMLSGIRDTLSGITIEIINVGKEYIYKAGLIPEGQKSKLFSAIRSFSNNKVVALERDSQRLITFTTSSMLKSAVRLNGLEKSLTILRPENVLLRGYTITSINGKILKRSTQVKIDDLINTRFSDGIVSSRVMGKKRRIG